MTGVYENKDTNLIKRDHYIWYNICTNTIASHTIFETGHARLLQLSLHILRHPDQWPINELKDRLATNTESIRKVISSNALITLCFIKISNIFQEHKILFNLMLIEKHFNQISRGIKAIYIICLGSYVICFPSIGHYVYNY
uniref:Uncharacterized protein n=1 Tax=Glossina pallidipes TaxID=7398 RepID=A0A1A9ZXW7_GLOPL